MCVVMVNDQSQKKHRAKRRMSSGHHDHLPTVAVYGCGIAGLATAHRLAERGFKVCVYEPLAMAGGLARSERLAHDKCMPSSVSWRGIAPWYKNLLQILKEIPVVVRDRYTQRLTVSSVFREELSHEMEFQLASDDPVMPWSLWQVFSGLDRARVAWLAGKLWLASEERSQAEYASVTAESILHRAVSSQRDAHNMAWVFGPFTGSDSSRASAHHVAAFFRKNLFTGAPAPYWHPASKDGDSKAFRHGSSDGWLIMKGPTNERWFEPWVRHLQQQFGVEFHFNTELRRLEYDADTHEVGGAIVRSCGISDSSEEPERRIEPDVHVFAMTPFACQEVLERSSPEFLERDPQLRKFAPLTAEGEHLQISFRLAFAELIELSDRQREMAMILVDSEYDITLYAESRLWTRGTDLGPPEIKTLWSGSACSDFNPGKLFGLTMKKLSRSQFAAEIMYQIYKCKSLDCMVRAANQGRPLVTFELVHFEVWHAWKFLPEDASPEYVADPRNVVTGHPPKWVTTTRTQAHLPSVSTSIPNLFLAGAYTRTTADLYCMEAAVESGCMIADVLTDQSTSMVQHMPTLFLPFQAFDRFMFAQGLPNMTVEVLVVVVMVMVSLLIGAAVNWATSASQTGGGQHSVNWFAVVLFAVVAVVGSVVLALYVKRRRFEANNHKWQWDGYGGG